VAGKWNERICHDGMKHIIPLFNNMQDARLQGIANPRDWRYEFLETNPDWRKFVILFRIYALPDPVVPPTVPRCHGPMKPPTTGPLSMTFCWINWGVSAVSVPGTSLLGHLLKGGRRGMDGFFQGGRSLPPWAMPGSIMALQITCTVFFVVAVMSVGTRKNEPQSG